MTKPNLRIKFGDKSVPVIRKEEKTKKQIEYAKQCGLQEIEQFNESYKAFKKSVDELTLFKDCLVQIDQSVDALIEDVLKPVLLGKDVQGVPDHVYSNLRLDIFKALIEKYEGKEDE